MANTRSTLERLSDWYLRHCDGEWEHGFGFEIRTLDNPGVAIDINLEDTELHRIPFEEVKDAYDSTDRWLFCRRTDNFSRRGELLPASKTCFRYSSIGPMPHTPI